MHCADDTGQAIRRNHDFFGLTNSLIVLSNLRSRARELLNTKPAMIAANEFSCNYIFIALLVFFLRFYFLFSFHYLSSFTINTLDLSIIVKNKI